MTEQRRFRRAIIPLTLLLIIFLPACALSDLTTVPRLEEPPPPGADPLAAGPIATAPPSESTRLDALLQAFALVAQIPGAPSPASLATQTWQTVAARLGQPAASNRAPVPRDELEAAWQWLETRLQGATGGPAAVAAAFPALAHAVGDCHTRYVPNFQAENARLEGSATFTGIGVAPGLVPGEAPVLLEVVPGSPAERLGLRLGDRLVTIANHPTEDLSLTQLVELLRGPPGTEVRLTVIRGNRLLHLAVRRGRVNVTLVEGATLDLPGSQTRRIGHIMLRGVAAPMVVELDKTVRDLQAQGARAWILDLRNNPGGDLPSLAQLAGHVIPNERLAVEIAPDGRRAVYTAPPGGSSGTPLATAPVVVLVNRNTLSGAEVLAASLSEHQGIPIVGEKTAGCLGTTRLNRLVDGSGLWLTTGALLTGRDERNLHRKGLLPDIELPATAEDLVAGRDAQLETAIAQLAQPR
ncbi:MAG: hypothetical protein CL878_05245 [Dehalococcoidia bacterium]|nr:hypothetical protein [Dehalococcoidia bacterium]